MKTSNAKKVVAIAVALLVVAAIAVAVMLLNRGDDAAAEATPTGPGGAQLDRYPVPNVDELDKVGAKAKQTEITSCKALDEGGWQAMGTVVNDAEKDRDYEITVFFMRDEESINFATTKVTAPAGGTVPWVAEKVFGTDDSLTCKLVAVS